MTYEEMWNELKQRVNLNISQQIPTNDLLQFMNALEEHFQPTPEPAVMAEENIE
jgi:hypothetical protein